MIKGAPLSVKISVLKSVKVMSNVLLVSTPSTLEKATALLKTKLSWGAETLTLEHDFLNFTETSTKPSEELMSSQGACK